MGQNGGMNLSAGFGAGAGATSLKDLLKQKFVEQIQQQTLKKDQEDQRQTDMQQQVSQAQLGLNTRIQNRQDEGERRADAASKQQQDYLNGLVNDASIPEPVRQAVRYHLGTGQNPPADLFKPQTPARPFVVAPGGKLVGPDGTELFSSPAPPPRPISLAPGGTLVDPVTSKPTYTAPARAVRIKGAADDPSLPLGAQRYITDIATKHGNDFNGARAELAAYVNDAATIAAHPHLSPEKAMVALKRAAGAPGGSTGGGDELDALIAQAFSGGPTAAPTAPGQRGAGPGVPVRIKGARVVGGGQGTAVAPDAPLMERARQVLQQGGYDTSDANVQKFLSIPANRQRLGGGQ